MFSDSIRWQIQAWHGALLLLITSVLLFSFYGYERQRRITQVDERLRSTLMMVLPALTPGRSRPRDAPPPPPRERRDMSFDSVFGDFLFGEPDARPEDRRPPERGGREAEIANGLGELRRLESTPIYTVAWNPEFKEMTRSVNAPKSTVPPHDETLPPGTTLSRTRDGFREIIHFQLRGESALMGTSIQDIDAAMRKLAAFLTAVGGGVVTIGLLGGWWLASRAIRPIAEISAAAEKIADGDLTRRIETHGAKSELGRLAVLLNHTFERLHNTFEQQAQFTADASHELRTPVSVILAQTELALMRDRSAEEYREALESCHRSGEQMKQVVNSLLELARMDSGESVMNCAPCYLEEVVEDAIRFVEPLVQQREGEIVADLEEITISVDAQKIQQVVSNLLSNAIKHNPEGCKVHVNLKQEGDASVLSVRDEGEGIPPYILPRVFERFFRADKARSRADGSTGLGLAITKAIVEAHGGTLTATSTPGQGSEFIVRLPGAVP